MLVSIHRPPGDELLICVIVVWVQTSLPISFASLMLISLSVYSVSLRMWCVALLFLKFWINSMGWWVPQGIMLTFLLPKVVSPVKIHQNFLLWFFCADPSQVFFFCFVLVCFGCCCYCCISVFLPWLLGHPLLSLLSFCSVLLPPAFLSGYPSKFIRKPQLEMLFYYILIFP